MSREIEAILEAYNYKPAGNCQCDGMFTLKYKRMGGYEVRWRRRSYTFKLTKDNDTLINWTQLALLKIHLEQTHGPTAVKAVSAE